MNGDAVDIEIRTEADAFLGELVLDSIEVERYAVAEYIQSVHLGNPSSGLGTGTIPESTLGLPNDQMWLAVTAYCQDHEQGDPFAVGYYDGPQYLNGQRGCGETDNYVYPEANPNPTFDPDAYVFVVEMQPGSPTVDIDVYEPGVGCGGSGSDERRHLGTAAELRDLRAEHQPTTSGLRRQSSADRHRQPGLEQLHRQQPERRRLVVARQQPALAWSSTAATTTSRSAIDIRAASTPFPAIRSGGRRARTASRSGPSAPARPSSVPSRLPIPPALSSMPSTGCPCTAGCRTTSRRSTWPRWTRAMPASRW